MFEIALLFVGIAGFAASGYLDLKFTEFPDWLPYLMIIAALSFRGAMSFFKGNLWILGYSVIVGISFLAIGLALYFAKQWGDGDAWLLGALGFLFPETAWFGVETVMPFPITLLFNFLLVSIVYLIIYSLFLGLKNRKINRKYLDEIISEKTKLSLLILFFFAFSWGFSIYMHFAFYIGVENLIQILLLPFLLTFVILFTYYARVVEKHLFKKKVKTSELREGDVIIDDKWKGLTKREVNKIKRERSYVWIKEGVRFAPVFLFTLLISIFYGDFIILFI